MQLIDYRLSRWSNVDGSDCANYYSRVLNTLRAAVVPGVIAGILSVFASWFWMGFLFHSYQRKTPEIWRPEGPRSYIAASVLHIIAAIGLACLLTLAVRFHFGFFSGSSVNHLCFALSVWIVMAVPIILEAAIFIRSHPLVVLGQLLDWLSTSVLASLITGWWLAR